MTEKDVDEILRGALEALQARDIRPRWGYADEVVRYDFVVGANNDKFSLTLTSKAQAQYMVRVAGRFANSGAIER